MPSFAATVSNWSERAERNMRAIVLQAIQDVCEEMTRPKDGLVRGAPFEEGVVPVDEGQLISSLIVEINGATTGRGGGEQPPDYVAALSGFDGGDVVIVAFTAEHARAIEYGANGVPGRFMVRLAAQQWQAYIDRAAARLKD